MMQVALIQTVSGLSFMFPYLVCIINTLSLSHFLFYLRLPGFSYCLTWHLFLSSGYQAHLTASCFASLFSFLFCYFQRACPLPILPSPTYFHRSTPTFCTLAFGILKVQSVFLFLFFYVCFVHVHSHCFTMPRATQVFCYAHSVSLETVFENSMWDSNMSCEGSSKSFSPLLHNQP